jgi:Family of unknown function (DUF5357)
MIEIFDQVRKTLTPLTWDSWQTLIWISVFSWAVSMLTTDLTQSIIATCAWLFLIPGVHWFLHTNDVKKVLTVNGIFIGPWITGALVSLFLFGDWTTRFPSLVFMAWPPISAVISVLPKFVAMGPKYKDPNADARQDIVIVVLVNLLLSCWFQLYFSTQHWIQNYPSLLAEDLQRSAFVVKLTPKEVTQSRGVALLNGTETNVRNGITRLGWPELEKWLLDLEPNMQAINSAVKAQGPELEENALWDIQARMLPGDDYNVELMAIWKGPRSDLTTKGRFGYYFSKKCQISGPSPYMLAAEIPKKSLMRLACKPVEGPFQGFPEPIMPKS